MTDDGATAKTSPAKTTGGLRRVTMTTRTGGSVPAPDKAPGNETTDTEPAPSSTPSRKAGTVVAPDTTAPVSRRSRLSASTDPYVGATVDGRYEVESILGEGGMGVVYRCRHTIIGKQVAMKVLRADLARNEEVVERFLNEARLASSIGNPHIIDISDFGRLPDDATYFIMEYLDGIPLTEVLEADEAITDERLGRIAAQLAEGLAAAHDAGIVHRDLKPDNIFLIDRGSRKDFVKILDFGIAKANSPGTKLTQAGQVFGTPHYMSPEQASGEPVDHRSDIYSVGVILYELATGKLPFDAENYMAILTQHMYKEPPRPSTLPNLVRPVSPELEDVVLRCLHKKPDDRFQSMTDLAGALYALYGDPNRDSRHDATSVVAAMSSGDVGRRTKTAGTPGATLNDEVDRRRRGLWLGLALAGLSAATVLALLMRNPRPDVTPVAVVEAAASEPLENATATEDPTSVTPSTVRVAIAANPLNAHVFVNGNNRGTSPVMIEVGETPLNLEVRAEGHVTEKRVIDGSRTKIVVDLKPETATAPRRAAAPRVAAPRTTPSASAAPEPTPPSLDTPKQGTPQQQSPPQKPAPEEPSLGGNDLVDPWD